MDATTANYVTDVKLAARQRLWTDSRREPPFDLVPWVLEVAGLSVGCRADVLDIGCGNGAYLAALESRRHQGNRVGADTSFGMLTPIRTAVTVQADVQGLSFADDSFDVVLAMHMLYHVPEITLAAHECRRVLRHHGRLVAVTNDPSNIAELKALVEAAVGGGWTMVMPHDERFGMHNGAEWLADAFDEVRPIAAPVSRLVVNDAEAVAAYVASMDNFYQPQVDVEWSVIVDRVRAAARSVIEREGSFSITNALGAFVCSNRSP